MNLSISKEVLDSILPKPSMINLPITDLKGKKFKLIDFIAPEANESASLSEKSKESGMIRLQYKALETGKNVVIGVRSLLFTPVSANKTSVKTPSPLHEALTEQMNSGDTSEVTLPAEFTVVDAIERVKEGTTHKVYPSYAYQEFQDKYDVLKNQGKTRTEINDAIYGDFNFISNLPGKDLAKRFDGKVGAIKNITIHIG